MGILIVGGTLAFLALLVAVASKPRAEERLFALAKKLGGHVVATNSIVGTCDQIRIGYRLITTGGGSSAVRSTEIGAEIPAGYPLAIYIRRQGSQDRAEIDRGELVDIEIGNAAFDARFLVEAAPAAAIKKLLDAEAVRYLMALPDLTLRTQDTSSGRRHLVLSLAGWTDDAETAGRHVAALARLAARVPEVFEELGGEMPVEMVGAPHREMPIQRENLNTPERQRDEVLRLEMKRASRLATQRIVAFAMIGAFLFVIAMVIAASR